MIRKFSLQYVVWSVVLPNKQLTILKECPRRVMVKVVHCGIVVSEFELQSRYYVHFRTNTLAKSMNPPSNGLNNITVVPLEEWIWH